MEQVRDFSVHQGRVRIATPNAQVQLHLKTGAWEFRSSAQKEALFACPGGETFCGNGSARFGWKLDAEDRYHGLGETTGPFNKLGLRRELWNVDVLGHSPGIHPGLKSLYVSIPFLVGIRQGKASAVFWDNPARQVWDLSSSGQPLATVRADLGHLDLYLFAGPDVQSIVRDYTGLTGRMPLPPRWALGYQQSRYSYESAKRVEEIAKQFRKRRIPCDAIHLDIHHMDEYRVFTFGKSFPHAKQLISKLGKAGFKTIAIVDPGVKKDPSFGVYKRGLKHQAFVTLKGKPYVGEVWPGLSTFPDFTSAAVRRWWGTEQRHLLQAGVAGCWNDMNEPANFALPTKTLPPDCLHETDFGRRTHQQVHNLYGMQMARASREACLDYAPNQRPFVISRAGYAGVQRYAVVWTGDNSSHWEHLADSLQMILNLSLSGVAFCGADVGGFLENAEAELLIRWTQLGAFSPFFRNHSNIGTRAQEPWAFGPKVEQICRSAIELRYRLLPYLSQLFIESHLSGDPIARPLCWHYQDDEQACRVTDQFMLGPDILICPVLHPGQVARAVYLPEGEWYHFHEARLHQGKQHILAAAPLERIPVFIRAGAMLPMTKVTQFIPSGRWKNLELHIWPGREPSELVWHEEDGVSQNYLHGEISRQTIKHDASRGADTLCFGPREGGFPGPATKWKVHVHLPCE